MQKIILIIEVAHLSQETKDLQTKGVQLPTTKRDSAHMTVSTAGSSESVGDYNLSQSTKVAIDHLLGEWEEPEIIVSVSG